MALFDGEFDAEGFHREYEENYGNKIPNPKDHMKPTRTSMTPEIQPTEPIYEGEVSSEKYKIQGRYKMGAHSIIYKAEDSETGKIVAVKKHLHYMPETDDPEAIRSAEDRFKREAQVLSQLSHPGIVRPYGFYFKKEEGVNTPHLVTELIERDSLEEKLKRGETTNEDEAKFLVLSVGTILDYLHTTNGKPIIYRDLKPDNIKVMSEDATWPHKLVDFSESRIGESTMSGSVMGTIGYNAPELLGGRMADTTVDFYSLFRVATHLLIGDSQKFMRNYINGLSLEELRDDGDLRVSDGFFRVLQKATAKNRQDRYRNFLEIARDLGYDIDRVPETRAELELILRGNSLPAQVQEPQTPEPEEEIQKNYREFEQESSEALQRREKSNLPEVVENMDGILPNSLTIDGFTIDKGKDIYETARNVYNHIGERHIPKHKDALGKNREMLYAYLQHAAKDNPIINRSLNGGVGAKSIEETAKELVSYRRYKKSSNTQRKLTREQYKERISELQEVLSDAEVLPENVDDRGGRIWNMGTPMGYIAGLFSSVIPGMVFQPIPVDDFLSHWVLPGTILGTTAGSIIHRQRYKSKLLSKARELDGMIYQAKVSQGLEKKLAPEDVVLSEDEEDRIEKKIGRFSTVVAISSIFGGGITGAIIGMMGGFEPHYIGIGFGIGSIAGMVPALPLGFASWYGLGKIRLNRALKHKRQRLGLETKVEKPEMKGYNEFIIDIEPKETSIFPTFMDANVKYNFKKNGLKKKFLRRKFIREGIEVKYQEIKKRHGLYSESRFAQIKIKARTQEQADGLANKIKETSQLNPSNDEDDEFLKLVRKEYTLSRIFREIDRLKNHGFKDERIKRTIRKWYKKKMKEDNRNHQLDPIEDEKLDSLLVRYSQNPYYQPNHKTL